MKAIYCLAALILALALSFCLVITGCTPIGTYACPEVKTYQEASRWIIRNIEYVPDIEAEGALDSWKHPELTLQDRYGDCEDMALLFLAIIDYNFGIRGELVVQGKDGIYHAYSEIPDYKFSDQGWPEIYRLSYRNAIALTTRR